MQRHHGQLTARREFLQRAVAGTAGLATVFQSAFSGAAAGSLLQSGAGALRPSGDPVKPELFFHPGAPRNGEPLLPRLVESWVTPVSQFYIRSHGLNPVIDLTTYRLSVEGLVDRPLQLSVQELTERFPQAAVTCTLTCAGNRRSEFSRLKPVSGVQWREGAIGNAEWSGVRLSDVLKAAGVQSEAKHVWFDGLDEVKDGDRTFPFGGSVPLTRVFDETATEPGTLLATRMNGEPLPMDHGMPVRTVVPGYIGARSVKWLGRVVVSDRPSPNHFVEDVYKILEADTPAHRDEAIPIYRFPVNSAICSTVRGTGEPGAVKLSGYALPAGYSGTKVAQVEVSADGGRNWVVARLGAEDRAFCWRLWTAELPLNLRTASITVRTTDSSGHQQPETVPWNPKGYLYNAWHSVPWPG